MRHPRLSGVKLNGARERFILVTQRGLKLIPLLRCDSRSRGVCGVIVLT